MTDEQNDLGQELGRMPEGSSRPLGAMPKPDIENASSYSLVRLIVLALIVFVGLAVGFLYLTQAAH